MSTPKSKKPSPLIAVNSPKVALWHQCKKCSVYLNPKDTGLHTCQDVMQVKYPFIKENTLYSLVEIAEGVDNQNINLDQLLLMSLSAIQLCKFQIGEPVHLTGLKQKGHICKTVWPTSNKSLLSVQVSKNVLQKDLKLSPGDALSVSSLSSLPLPLSSVYLHCSGDITQYESDSLTTAVASQMRSTLVHVGQTVNIGFYGMELSFNVQKVAACAAQTNEKQTPQDTSVAGGGDSTLDSIDDNLRSLSLNEKKSSNEILFYKIVSSTKFVITNYKSRSTEGKAKDGVEYRLEDMGGLGQIVENIINILNISLRVCPSIEGMRKCNGILIHGVNGTGKTSLIHSLAAHMNVYTAEIPVADLFSKYYGEAESRLKASFDLALDNAPALVLLDNLDVLCSAKNRSDQERRVLSCLVSQMDRLHELQACVVLLAVVTSLDSVEVLLRSPGRLDQEIELPVPSRNERLDIFQRLLAKVPHTLSETQIEEVAFVTHGFVGADLAALISSAATSALLAAKEGTENSLVVKDGTMGNSRAVNIGTSVDLAVKKRTTELSYDHVILALDTVKPSAMRQVLVEVPNVRWSDIGGQAEVKLKLRQSVEWPLKHPEAFARLGIKPPRGILMFGPPGCSKTMIAKALATESKLNFISVKGPELFRKYVGESERCVRDVFKRARQVSPSVIFFDELDALAGERGEGGGGGGSNVQERVLAQMLTEMDGIVPLNNVTIVAATNRPDRIDKALLRPGRLDRLIYVPLPDDETRAAILELRLGRSPVAADVKVAQLVEATRGYSGAELVAVCDEAALFALENDLNAASVTQRDFLAALQVVKPRTPPQLVQLYENYVKK